MEGFLTPDARTEFQRWLGQQKGLSPRCIIVALNNLADFARRRGEQVAPLSAAILQSWIRDLRKKPPICGPDLKYPMRRSLGLPFIALAVLLLAGLLLVGVNCGTVSQAFSSLIDWISATFDRIEAVILLIVLIGGSAFAFFLLKQWYDRETERRGQPPELTEGLEKVWQMIRSHFPGRS